MIYTFHINRLQKNLKFTLTKSISNSVTEQVHYLNKISLSAVILLFRYIKFYKRTEFTALLLLGVKPETWQIFKIIFPDWPLECCRTTCNAFRYLKHY